MSQAVQLSTEVIQAIQAAVQTAMATQNVQPSSSTAVSTENTTPPSTTNAPLAATTTAAASTAPPGCLPLPTVRDVSPLRAEVFAYELRNHPDQRQVEFVLSGIRHGFQLGFQSKPLQPAARNKQSALDHPDIVDEYLRNEVRLGRVAGPFRQPPFPYLHISSFGVIPKSGQPGKWRLIVDLSSPDGLSVNDGIDADSFSLQYIKVDDIIRMVDAYGPGALMAKFDVLAAFRNIAIHPADRPLLGMMWHSEYYVDLALPFGLRSAPFIFDSVASLVEWILRNNYQVPSLLHYLDDFILAGPPQSDTCRKSLVTAIKVCARLGLPLHPDKCEGPATSLVVLGIELDSVNRTARLPAGKLSRLRTLLDSWADRHWCRRHDLESLIGHLHHAAKVIWPGRAFIRRMINTLSCFRNSSHPIRLNNEFHLDLCWWRQCLESWNGVSFWLFPGLSHPPSVIVTSDASGALGYGAYSGHDWFNGLWLDPQKPLSIAYKELFPVVIAGHVWGFLSRGSLGTPQTNACIGPTPPATAISSLTARCHELLVHGLAPSTRRSYSTGQRRFINFCAQIGKLHDNGSACPADEWTLCLFAAFLSSQVQHATIKVYLSAVRALHIELGFADPLSDALRLERVIRGIKRSQGSTKADRLPVTDDIMRLIHTHLDFRIVDHLMFWAACCLAYFGFLRSAEFTVPSLEAYSPVYNLNVSDISVDALDQPTCIRKVFLDWRVLFLYFSLATSCDLQLAGTFKNRYIMKGNRRLLLITWVY
ncbi:hypothetical protein AC249_AIPGENE9228 [Exaiptasia diaphana]|nr:hypothetical protein AC249_AIPGENE9228 [Exaiptasia diaphana]